MYCNKCDIELVECSCGLYFCNKCGRKYKCPDPDFSPGADCEPKLKEIELDKFIELLASGMVIYPELINFTELMNFCDTVNIPFKSFINAIAFEMVQRCRPRLDECIPRERAQVIEDDGIPF
ncbi:MAG: hypothetical protein SPI91_05585 [Bacilli bacterium]|uniref:hypothetical protein n=1 Tax=Paraclostridium bifermentans TaxID=1490 RepID=UPI00241BEF24|nr:hypothetical protein [Paraclostridium bifermentans]MCI6668261.1 hypothetical protein [Romboutsia timonensis]MDY6015903.1 hypothetical protein [Bacilli bacterium]